MKRTIIMPDLGQTSAEGKIVKWNKLPSDHILKGEILLEVETDKVTMDVEAYETGYLRAHLVAEGGIASALSPIAILTDTPDEPYENSDLAPATGTKAVKAAPDSIQSSGGATPAAGPAAVTGRIAVSPLGRRLARELGVDAAKAIATGPDGLVTRRDIERLASARSDARPLAAMAGLVSQSALTIPHFFVTVDIDAAAMLQWRENWNASHPESKVFVNDIFVRAASRALRDTPQLNVYYRDGRVQAGRAAHVLVVVAAERGLALVPVHDPSDLPWSDYLAGMRSTLDLARQGRVSEWRADQPPALAVSNLGMFRVRQFTAIIPPGSTAILAVGAIGEEAIVRDKQIKIGQLCRLTLAADHRVVDGITVAKFLQRIQEHLNAL